MKKILASLGILILAVALSPRMGYADQFTTGKSKSLKATSVTLYGSTSGSFALTADATAVNLVVPVGIQLSGASGAATTISTTTTNANILLSPNGNGVVVNSGGLQFSGASGTATTISTTATNASLFIAPNGTGSVTFNAGADATPSISFVGGLTSGFDFLSTNTVVKYIQNGTAMLCFGCSTNAAGANVGGLNNGSTSHIGWSSTADPTLASDLILARGGAAQLRVGGTTAASPVNQIIGSVQARGGTDTDAVGSQFTLRPGLGTGTASAKLLVISGDQQGQASGSTIHTAVQRHVFNGSAILVTTVAKTIVSIPLATGKTAGGSVSYSIFGYNATDQCVTSGRISYSAENKAAAFTVLVSPITAASTACSTGTLTVTWAMTSATPSLLQATATLSLSSPTAFRMEYEAANFSDINTDPTYTTDGQ